MKVEFKNQPDKTGKFGTKAAGVALVTPPIDEEYWVARVNLYKDQSIVAFPKFMTIGIGFAQETNWNTNLPYSSNANTILNHIWENHKYNEIKKADALKAIRMLQSAIKKKIIPEMKAKGERVG